MIVEEFGIDGRVWQKQALEVSAGGNCTTGYRTHKTKVEKTTVRSPQARNMI